MKSSEVRVSIDNLFHAFFYSCGICCRPVHPTRARSTLGVNADPQTTRGGTAAMFADVFVYFIIISFIIIIFIF